MSRLIEAYNFIMREYEYIYQRFPLWLALVLASLVLVGVIVAFANRNKHNFLVWIVPVILFPVFSTFVLVAWAIVLLVIKRKKGFIPGKYFLNKGRVVFITLITVAAGIYVVYFSNGMLPFINEAFVTGIAVLCIFLTYFGTLRRYSHDARFMQICRLDGNMSKNDYRKNDYIYCAFSSDLLPSVDDEDPLDRLKNTRGWEPAYNVINSFVVSHRNRFSGQKSEQEEEVDSGIERLEPNRAARASVGKVPNFVLQGPPGVGKTEIANLIGQILQKEGILKSGHTVVGSRDKLIGQYVGSTAIQTASMIEQAQEGVLLIDEVYNLAEDNENMHGANYSAECINTLVAAMTNKNYRFCVIFAGYASRMDKVWNMNEGLFSRFGDSNVINIEGYEPDLLRSIFEGQIKGYDQDSGQKYQLSETVINNLDVFFENLYNERDRENFGNARDMNVLAASVKRAAGYRYIQNNISGDIIVDKCDFGDKVKLFEKKGLSAEDIYSSIYEYVGLDFLVDMFNDQLAIKIECEEKGIDYPGPSHMIWCGNPGTGKSTAAQLTIDLYHALGILGGTKPIYVDASELMSYIWVEAQSK